MTLEAPLLPESHSMSCDASLSLAAAEKEGGAVAEPRGGAITLSGLSLSLERRGLLGGETSAGQRLLGARTAYCTPLSSCFLLPRATRHALTRRGAQTA